jgi:Family of unknown function (DUF5677)
VNKPLPFLTPVDSVLALTPEDQCLEKGWDSVLIPPRTLEEARFLTYYVIRQCVYAGTHILDHLLNNPPGYSSHLAPLMLYRHTLELGDAIGTLLRFGSSTAASILVRSLFETSLGLEFILEKNTFHEDRASCYQAFYQIERFKNFTRYDPGTTEGAKLHRILDDDKKLNEAVFPRKDLTNERHAIEKVLNSKRYKPYWDKYKAVKHKPKQWYSLCSKAPELWSLAQLIGRESEYVLLYKMLSESAHASDVLSGVLRRKEERMVEVHKLRGPVEKTKETASLAAGYLVGCHNLILDTYLKGHDLHQWFVRWYIGDYRSSFMWVISPTPLIPLPPAS